MILEGYGKPIYDFSTADEVLFAFRDAIAGTLFGIIYRSDQLSLSRSPKFVERQYPPPGH